MNDNTKMRRYYASKLDETPASAPPETSIKSMAASSAGFHPVPKWETAFGLLVTICYLIHFLNPYNWFSLGRFFLALTNGFSFSRFIWGSGIGF